MVTQKDGKYSFELKEDIVDFTLRFKDNGSQPKYNAVARFSVPNDANPKELDTQRLVSAEQAGKDENAAKQAAHGNARYERSANSKEKKQVAEYFKSYYKEAAKGGSAFKELSSRKLDYTTKEWYERNLPSYLPRR